MAVDSVRYFDLACIFLSCGFMVALGLRIWDLGVKIPWYLHALAASYVMFAISAAIEIQLALADHLPVTWRTVIVTLAALLGVTASGSAYIYWVAAQGGNDD